MTSPYTGATTYALSSAMAKTTGTVNPKPVTLPAATNVLTADFGYNWSGQIGDTYYYDTNLSGTQGGGEAGVPNATVVLVQDANGNGAVDPGELAVATTFTDGSGVYHFGNLAPGKYVVQADATTVAAPPSSTHAGELGLMQPTNGYGEYFAVTLAAGGSNPDADFGFAEVAKIEGHAFYDANNDGVLESGEGLLSGVTVTLTGLDTIGNTVSTTMTTVNGEYFFLVPAGNYSITYNPASGGAATYPVATTPTTISLSVLSGVEYPNNDFGRTWSGKIGNRVWNDVDGNGVQDTGEPGMPVLSSTCARRNRPHSGDQCHCHHGHRRQRGLSVRGPGDTRLRRMSSGEHRHGAGRLHRPAATVHPATDLRRRVS